MTSFKEYFSDFFELPDEVILDAPLIMIVGRRKMYFENHKGIAVYQDDLIKIRIKSGYFMIKGKNLEIEEIAPENILVSGEIKSLDYDNGRGQDND